MPARPQQQEPYSNWLEGYLGVRCADAEYPRRLAHWRALGDMAGRDSRFGELWWWQDAPCSKWPAAPDRYAGPWTARTAAPILIVGNFFDPATHYSGAVASNQLLSNSRLLSYAGWGHCAFGRSQCATEYILSYLTDGSLPAEGTVCPANANPFAAPEDPSLARLALVAKAPRVPPPPIGLPPPRPGRP
jgi:hypothetical protein